jgi:chromosomal replication initiation ATPase DnaA
MTHRNDPHTAPRSEWHAAHYILRTVARHYGHTVNELLADNQTLPLREQRQIAMYMCREHTDLSYPDLGVLFRRHHTSVLHSIQMTEKSRSKRLKAEVSHMDTIIGAALSVARGSIPA